MSHKEIRAYRGQTSLKYYFLTTAFTMVAAFLGACADSESTGNDIDDNQTSPSNQGESSATGTADVISVTVSGQPGAYSLAVTVASPDTGCQSYANWWEVLSLEGQLIYRRTLAHSHTNEQPFVRSGGPIIIEADTEVIVRAHMNSAGYGGKAVRGSVAKGFATDSEIGAQFAVGLGAVDPQPGPCAF